MAIQKKYLIRVHPKDKPARESTFHEFMAHEIFKKACRMGLDPSLREIPPEEDFPGIREVS